VSESPPSPSTASFTFAVDERSVGLLLSEDLYPLDAIYGAAYLFVDRCYVFLDRPGDKQVQVRFRAKSDAADVDLEALAGEFCNEVLNQVVRQRVGESTRTLREYYLARAFFGDDTRASIDALLAELDADELEDDPLEIQVPWDTTPPSGSGAEG
jgi:His-Xaa-Ser system protein HxsD